MGVNTKNFITRLLVIAAFGAIGVAPLTGAAQDDDQLKAREFYQQGKELYDAGKFVESLEAFQSAYDTKPHPVVLKSIAECQVQLLDIKAAIATLEKYLADPTPTDKPEVEQRLAAVRKELASVEITSVPEGAGVMLGGSVTGLVTPATIELNPGDHEVVLNLDDWEPLLKSITLTGGEHGRLDIDFDREGTPAMPDEETLADPFGEYATAPLIETGTEGPPAAFWVAAAVAGVGLISGTVFGTMALGDEDDFKKSGDEDIKKSGERNAIIADVSFGVAAAAAIVGAVILITNKGEAEVDMAKARFDVHPVATGDHLGVSTSLYF